MMKLLIILVVILGIVALSQLAKVYEHTRELRKTREEDISYADNRMNAFLWILWMIVFFGASLYLMVKYTNTLPESASEHGVALDMLMNVNLWFVTIVFFSMNGLLFFFSAKYYYRKDRVAKFFPHDNRLELIWTIIPSIVLAFLIIYGLRTWNEMTGNASEAAIKVEVTSEQFKWYVRYPGQDNVLGAVNVNMIDPATQNLLGIITEESVPARLETVDGRIVKEKEKIDSASKLALLPESAVEAIEDKIFRLERLKQRILDIRNYEVRGVNAWAAGADDIIASPAELHLPVGVEVELNFRSKDVIHSAYLPHFRAQMNTVPGIPTRFKMTPTITTAEMREKLDDPDFDYLLLCNKICGVSHYNMKIPVIVESQAEYEAWLAAQPTFVASEDPAVEDEATDEANEEVVAENVTAEVITNED
jgi:cytochrome c oxidase subunit 2